MPAPNTAAEIGREVVADVLERAASLIEPEGAWCQGRTALDASKNIVPATSAKAVCWCAFGAIARIAPGLNEKYAAEQALRKQARVPTISAWNDAQGRTQSEVVAMFRSAALKARAVGEGRSDRSGNRGCDWLRRLVGHDDRHGRPG